MSQTRLAGVGFTHHQAIIIPPCSSASIVRALPMPRGALSIAKEHKKTVARKR